MKKIKLAKKKKIILAVTSLVLVIAIGVGIFVGVRQSNKEPIKVFPFEQVGMTEYWGDSQESYGPVTTDKIQTVFLSTTQTVTEIKVAQGDMVKKGDILMTFDTTLDDLALERKRLAVEKLKLQLEDAEKELRQIKAMKPMVIPTYPETDVDEDTDYGMALTDPYQVSKNQAYDGSSQEKSLICWLRSDTSIDNSLLEALRQVSYNYQNANVEPEPTDPEPTEPEPTDPEPTDPEPTDPEPTDPEPTDPEPTDPEPPEPTEPEPTEPKPTEPQPTDPEPTQTFAEGQNLQQPASSASASSEQPGEPEIIEVTDYYVVFKITEGNMSLGSRTLWQGFHVSGTISGGFRFQFFNANAIPDHTLIQSDDEYDTQMPEIDFGSGYTAAQIAQMRSEQEKKIKELEFEIKMAEADYKIMQTEVSDGNVYADIDGKVVSLLTEEEAKQTQQPIMKVSGGGGFYISCSISELEKEKMVIGQEVTVNDWNTGMVYTGTVESMGDFPSADGYWNGMGNPNTTYYPFTVFVDETADLQAGQYASVTYSAGTSENGIYLQNPFLRTEKGQSFVYLLGENGKLEKRYVTTGKSLWGSYTEILSGLTAEDMVAFPYGKEVKEGAAAVDGDVSELYENY